MFGFCYCVWFEKLVFNIIHLFSIINMEDVRFNVIFSEDLDDDYENIMNRVVDHINYHGGDDNSGSGGDDDDGENDDDDNSDEDDESF